MNLHRERFLREPANRGWEPTVASLKQVLRGMCSERFGETKSQANKACRPDVDGIFCLARFLMCQSNE